MGKFAFRGDDDYDAGYHRESMARRFGPSVADKKSLSPSEGALMKGHVLLASKKTGMEPKDIYKSLSRDARAKSYE